MGVDLLTDSHIFSQYSGISSHSFGCLYYAPKPTVPFHNIKLIMVNFLTMNSLPPAIISTKPLSVAELVHTIKMELLKTETNS